MNHFEHSSIYFPLTFPQREIFIDQSLHHGETLYNIGGYMRINGALDVERFRQSLQYLLQKHDTLRTVFLKRHAGDVLPVQTFAAQMTVDVPMHDLRHHARPHANAMAWMRQCLDLPFNILDASASLFRYALLKVDTDLHYAFVCYHHLIADGWTVAILARSIARIYSTLQEGNAPDLQAPSYQEFIADDIAYRRSSTYERDRRYWLDKFATHPEPLFSMRYPACSASDVQPGGLSVLTMSRKRYDALGTFAAEHGATIFHLLLGALYVYFARIYQRDELTFGLPVLNRSNAKFKATAGLFVSLTPARFHFCADIRFDELLREMHRELKRNYRHQRFPLGDLIAEIFSADASRPRLYDLSVSYKKQNYDVAFGEAKSHVSAMINEHQGTPLTLWVCEFHDDEPVQLEFAFNRAYFSLDEVETIQRRFLSILDHVQEQPNIRVKNIPLLTEHEFKLTTLEWNATKQKLPATCALQQLIEAQSDNAPDAAAVVFGDQVLTYRELNVRANRLAHYLQGVGVMPEVTVGICAVRSIDMIVAILAILKAGGAYLPLDPNLPPSRLAYMIEDARPVLILAGSGATERLPECQTPLFHLDQDLASLDASASDNPKCRTFSAHPAYIIYTSGSSGKPKGVQVTHGSVIGLVLDWCQRFDVVAEDRWLQWCSFGFDVSIFEIFVPLAAGASLWIVPDADRPDPVALIAWMRSQRITCAYLPPAFVRWLHEDPSARAAGLSLRSLLVGVEPLSEQGLSSIQGAIPGLKIANGYGPTEATVYCSLYQRIGTWDRVCPIGRPIANVQIYLLDRHLNAVPIGTVGELYVAGSGLARGYFGQSAMTAERFVPNRFGNEPGSRMYRTGDLARQTSDGQIEFVGRADHQIKIRGFRVELGEIEAAMAMHPAVRDAVVLVREDGPGGRQLVAYLVPRHGVQALSAVAMRETLMRSLPEYMIPAHFVVLDDLPMNANGKVDRRNLPAPQFIHSVSTQSVSCTPLERKLISIWANVLQLQEVGVQDNFFSLGGNSILAITLTERLRSAGIRTDARTLFANPTIAGLALALTGLEMEIVPPNRIPPQCESITPDMLTLVELTTREISQVVATVDGGSTNIQDIYPLAPMQEGILFHHLRNTKVDPYVLSLSFCFSRRAHLHRFIEAVQTVIDRHDVLRTAIVWEGLAEPVQVVWRRVRMRIDEIQIGEEQTGASPRNLVPCRLDVRHAPMMRGLVFKDADNGRWTLNMSLHHLVGDLKTLENLISETLAIIQGAAAALPEPIPFRNFIARTALETSKALHKDFFQRMLSDVDEPTAPFGLVNLQGDGGKLPEARREVDSLLAQRVREQARSLGVGVSSLIHLAWALVLGRMVGRKDVVFGTVMSGRAQSATNSAMGIYINTLPVRIRLSGKSTVQALQETHDLLMQMLQHENAPLSLALHCSKVAQQTTLFSAILNYRHGSPKESFAKFCLESPYEGMELLDIQEQTNYPFGLSVEDSGKGFSLVAQTDAIIMPDRLCEFMHTALVKLVETLASTPSVALDSVDVLPDAERRLLLVDWNRTQISLPISSTVTALFEAQVAHSPENPALVFEGQSITYGELNRRANRLAHYLREFGVGPEDLVGICMERSPEMIVAVLGVLKAGGAYLPLDPAMPSARFAFMFDNAKPSFLLTQERIFDRLKKPACAHICLDRNIGQLASRSVDNPVRQTQPDNLAYVIYTSGSTGKPKGVLLYHRALVNLVLAQAKMFGMRPRQRVLQWASFNFDVSVSDIFTALCSGANLFLASREALMPGPDLWNTLRLHRIEMVAMTASALTALPQEPLPDLETLIVGGEQIDETQIAPWLNNRTVINSYGPTEATVCTVFHPCTSAGRGSPPIGRPISNTEAYVLDRWLRPMPIGATGELYLAGEGLARGYLNLPELTAERFLQNPFSSRPGARMYKTGDLVRYLPDGNISFVGRIDDQVKIRGHRIELGEIEFALNQSPVVQGAAVRMQTASSGIPFLVAYVTPFSAPLNIDALRRALRDNLPDYMIPAHFVAIDKLPIGTNGKIDRTALDALAWEDIERPIDAILTTTEAALAKIWTTLTGCERIGRGDNFFLIGGHSLLAVKLIARVKQELEVSVSISQVFSSPTLQEFALAVEGASLKPALLVTLQRGSAGIPIFLMHPSGGTIFAYEKLARHLVEAGPVYAVQSPEIAGIDLGAYDFDTLCTRYADEIDAVCPSGSVRLAGWSMGGMLALGVTAILEHKGRTVDRVGMFDTYPPQGGRFTSFPDFLDTLLALQTEISSAEAQISLRAACDRLRYLMRQQGAEHVFGILNSAESSPGWLETHDIDATCINFVLEQYAIQRRHFEVMLGFRPITINAPLHLVWAEASNVNNALSSPDWLAYSKDLRHSTQCTLPGNHLSVILHDSNQAIIVDILTQ